MALYYSRAGPKKRSCKVTDRTFRFNNPWSALRFIKRIMESGWWFEIRVHDVEAAKDGWEGDVDVTVNAVPEVLLPKSDVASELTP
jgi:hypothetical protein